MNQNERELLTSLHSLASDGPQEAPAYVRERLLMEFRKRMARKRRMAWLSAASVGAIAAVLLIFVAMPRHDGPSRASALPAANATATLESSAAVADETDAEFYPLPEAEGLPPVENAAVIRVQMPIESLQLMGLDVNVEGSSEPVQADILLGQDGLARAVRLVQ